MKSCPTALTARRQVAMTLLMLGGVLPPLANGQAVHLVYNHARSHDLTMSRYVEGARAGWVGGQAM